MDVVFYGGGDPLFRHGSEYYMESYSKASYREKMKKKHKPKPKQTQTDVPHSLILTSSYARDFSQTWSTKASNETVDSLKSTQYNSKKTGNSKKPSTKQLERPRTPSTGHRSMRRMKKKDSVPWTPPQHKSISNRQFASIYSIHKDPKYMSIELKSRQATRSKIPQMIQTRNERNYNIPATRRSNFSQVWSLEGNANLKTPKPVEVIQFSPPRTPAADSPLYSRQGDPLQVENFEDEPEVWYEDGLDELQLEYEMNERESMSRLSSRPSSAGSTYGEVHNRDRMSNAMFMSTYNLHYKLKDEGVNGYDAEPWMERPKEETNDMYLSSYKKSYCSGVSPTNSVRFLQDTYQE